MTKKVKHMGMDITENEHKVWHEKNNKMTPDGHKRFLSKMGITDVENKEWHKRNCDELDKNDSKQKTINPFFIGGGFLQYCIRKGWIIQKDKGKKAKYYVTNDGKKELRKFDINI